MIEIIPTNTCPPDFAELSRRSQIISGFAKQVQLDVDDGVFAPEISWPYREGQWAEFEAMAVKEQILPQGDIMKYEAHLMVEEPMRIGELLARVGCTRILAHAEAFKDVQSVMDVFSMWRAAGASEVGLAVLLDTPLSPLQSFIEHCDVVQLMSIATLGRQGAPFEPRIIDRIQELHTTNPNLTIAVDGGVSPANIAELVHAGASRFGVGSAIMKAENPKAAYETLKTIAENALQ
jgi:ribulose-phosphate 3-epimerase